MHVLALKTHLQSFQIPGNTGEQADAATLACLRRINTRGVTFLNATTWQDGRSAMRIAFSNYSTQLKDLVQVMAELEVVALC
jgi:hypothetical protein